MTNKPVVELAQYSPAHDQKSCMLDSNMLQIKSPTAQRLLITSKHSIAESDDIKGMKVTINVSSNECIFADTGQRS